MIFEHISKHGREVLRAAEVKRSIRIQHTQKGDILKSAWSGAALPHVCRLPLCRTRLLWTRRTPAARETVPPPGRGAAYTTSAGVSWTPYRNRERQEELSSSLALFALLYLCVCVCVCSNLWTSLTYVGILSRRVLLSRITRIKWANSFSSATWNKATQNFHRKHTV